MSAEIKAIETRYKGYRFRSRLEARWAVFFENAGWRWEYEPQGFVFDNRPYLPDFRLYGGSDDKSWTVYVEIKPGNAKLDEEYVDLLGHASAELGSLLLIAGNPWPDDYRAIIMEHVHIGDGCALDVHGCKIGICPCCGDLWTVYVDTQGVATEDNPGLGEERFSTADRREIAKNSERTAIKAFKAARSARFEHGESG